MRRGQVTLFVMIGLVVLLAVGLFFLVDQDDASSSPGEEQAEVANFVQQCLGSIGEESIRTVGLHGGYTPEQIAQFNALPTKDTEVIVNPPQNVLFWHEVHDCPAGEQGCIGEHIPALCKPGAECPRRHAAASETSFQQSIETLVEERIATCLGDFESMPGFSVRTNRDPEVTALIREQDVLLTLEYPLEVTTPEGTRTGMDLFSASVPVQLPLMYDLATGIYDAHRNQNFLERVFLHLISVYMDINSPIPPFRDTDISGNRKIWITADVQKTIEDQVLPFMNFVQIVNAKNYVPLTSPGTEPELQPYAEGIYKYLEVKLSTDYYPVDVQFEYPGTGMYLDINDGKQVLKPRELPGLDQMMLLGGLRFLEFKHRYKAAFPIIVKLADDTAFNGNGFDLQFGLEANIWNNRPLNVTLPTAEFNTPDTTVDLTGPQQLVEHEYVVSIRDRHSRGPVPNAVVSYLCGYEIQAGVTDDEGIWRGRLPYCAAGGTITVEKIGYMGTGVPQDNYLDDRGTTAIEIAIWPQAEKKVTIFKRSPADISNLTLTGVTPATSDLYKTLLEENDSVILTFAREKEKPHDERVPWAGILQFGTIGDTASERGNQRYVIEEAYREGSITQAQYAAALETIDSTDPGRVDSGMTRTIDLVPGRYEVLGLLSYNGLVVIPKEEFCEDIDPLGIIQECGTIQASNFSSWLTGGAIFEGANMLTLTEEFIYSNKSLTLFMLEQPLPVSWSAMEEYQNIETFQTYQRRDMILPSCGRGIQVVTNTC